MNAAETENMRRLEAIVAELPEAERIDIEAWDDHPAFKVRMKNFVFADQAAESMSVKLSKDEAAAVVATDDSVEPLGYGLGRHGWISFAVDANADEERWEIIREWVRTSYTLVAPKSLAASCWSRTHDRRTRELRRHGRGPGRRLLDPDGGRGQRWRGRRGSRGDRQRLVARELDLIRHPVLPGGPGGCVRDPDGQPGPRSVEQLVLRRGRRSTRRALRRPGVARLPGRPGQRPQRRRSGGEAVVVPEGTGNDWSAGNESGAVELCFAVPSAGTYRIETTDIAPDQLSNSYWVYLDGGAAWLDDVEATPTFAPNLVNDRNGANPIEVDLTAGDHTLVFANREDGTTLDRVRLIPVP